MKAWPFSLPRFSQPSTTSRADRLFVTHTVFADIGPALPWAGLVVAVCAIFAVGILRFAPKAHKIADGLFLWPLLGFATLLFWHRCPATPYR
jgi:hypothetical protein